MVDNSTELQEDNGQGFALSEQLLLPCAARTTHYSGVAQISNTVLTIWYDTVCQLSVRFVYSAVHN